MSSVILNYKTRILAVLIVGFIFICTITAISMYSMYQYHISNAYKDSNRIIRLYQRGFEDINKELEYLKLIDFSKSEESILNQFKTISKIIYEKNSLVNGIVLIKQFKKQNKQKEEKTFHNTLNLPLHFRPINNYLQNPNKTKNYETTTAIYHREPPIMEKDIRGVDILSEKNRFDAVNKMNFLGRSYITVPTSIVNGSNGHKNSMILYYPLYKENSKDTYYKWFLAVPITPKNLLNKLEIRYSFIEDFIIQLYDYKSSSEDLLCEDKNNCIKEFTKLSSSTFNFAGKENLIVVGIKSIYTLENFWQPILGFTSGIIFLILIGYYLLYKEKKEFQITQLEMQILKAQEISQIGHFTWDYQTNQFTCSNEVVEIFKLSKNTISPTSLISKLYKDDYQKVQNLLKNLVNKKIKSEGQIEYRIITSGKTKWLLTKYNAIYVNNTLQDIFGVIQDITEFKNKEEILKKQSEELKKLATIDKLTNIYNRSYFDEQLDNQLDQFKRYKIAFSIILFDIDHFKHINDNFGHDTGDLVLSDISKTTKATLRKSDIFARWGGEEFIILLPNINVDKARIVAEKLRNLIEEHKFSEDLNVTCSFGVTQVEYDDTDKKLFKRVDSLLYNAKAAGRNKVIIG